MSKYPDKVYVTDDHDIPTFHYAVSDSEWSGVDFSEYIRSELIPQWQPIETAPKDGSAILTWTRLYGYADEFCVMYWGDKEWMCLDAFYLEPTHWMPLPEEPK